MKEISETINLECELLNQALEIINKLQEKKNLFDYLDKDRNSELDPLKTIIKSLIDKNIKRKEKREELIKTESHILFPESEKQEIFIETDYNLNILKITENINLILNDEKSIVLNKGINEIDKILNIKRNEAKMLETLYNSKVYSKKYETSSTIINEKWRKIQENNQTKFVASILVINLQKKQVKEETTPNNVFFLSKCHDLRENLASLSSGVDLLHEDLAKQEKEELLLIMKVVLKSQEKTIESTEKNYNKFFEKCNLSAIIIQIKNEFSLKNKLIVFNKKTNYSFVLGDSIDLKHIFFNIIQNSFDAMEKEKPVSITLDGDHQSQLITIKDTGMGIAKENLDKIFDPYFSTKIKNKHDRGLGLSRVKNIITRHNGSIKINSDINLGTEFIIKLPTY